MIFQFKAETDDLNIAEVLLALQGLTITNVFVASPTVELNPWTEASAYDLAVRSPVPVGFDPA